MAEPVNPGFDPPRRGRIGDPAKAIGGNSNAVQAMASRIQSLERLLQSYREKQVQVRRDDGTFQTITVLAKEGGGEAGGSYGSTLVPETIYQKDGVWRLVFHQAMFAEHSLAEAGKMHEIKTTGGNLTADPAPEIPLSGKTEKVWLKFSLTPECTVEADSPEIVIGEEPKKKPMEPKRPGADGKTGNHVQHVGTVEFKDNVPEWKPINSDASVSLFLPAIEKVGDGETDYETYQAKPPTDKIRTFRGQNAEELQESGYTDALEKEFGESSTSGFEIRELPVKVTVEVIDNTLVFKGTCKVPVPRGLTGAYSWNNCGGDSGPLATMNRGVVTVANSNAGGFEACACGSCDGETSTDTPGV